MYSDDSLPPPCVYCAYEGHAFNPDYTFAPEDVPLRCDIVVYGHYLFDGTPDEEDESNDNCYHRLRYTIFFYYVICRGSDLIALIKRTELIMMAQYYEPENLKTRDYPTIIILTRFNGKKTQNKFKFTAYIGQKYGTKSGTNNTVKLKS